MRILHTSDWHIGRQFHNASLLDDQRHVLEQIIKIVRRHRVDVVLVAGDIYDRSVPPAQAVELLDEIIHRISAELGVPIIMIAGNHDGAERIAFGARQLARAGVHIFARAGARPEPVVLHDDTGEVAFYGLPYTEPATARDVFGIAARNHDDVIGHLTAQVRADNPRGRRCVVLSHCFMDGGESSDSERPLSVGGADKVAAEHFHDFHYAALGHLHGPQQKSAPHIRYSGSILKYSFSEHRHRKSVVLADMDQAGRCAIELIALEPLRDMRVLEGSLNDILMAGKADVNNSDYLLVRLSDPGAILDIMGKLREVYPNVLHLERPGLTPEGNAQGGRRAELKKGVLPLFSDFYEQMAGEALPAEAIAMVGDLLVKLQQE